MLTLRITRIQSWLCSLLVVDSENGAVAFGLDSSLLLGAALCSVGFSSIPGLCPLSASKPPATQWWQPNVCTDTVVSLGGHSHSSLRTLTADLLTGVSRGLAASGLPPFLTLCLWTLETFSFILSQLPYPEDLAVAQPRGVMLGWAETEHVLYSWIQRTCS